MIKESYIVTMKEIKYLEDGVVIWTHEHSSREDRIKTIEHLESFGADFTIEEPIKASARMEFSKYVSDRTENRYMTVDVVITAKADEDALYNIYDAVAEKLEAELEEYGVAFARCPYTNKKKNGALEYGDMFTADFELGMMGEMKKEFLKAFKSVKKELGIR